MDALLNLLEKVPNEYKYAAELSEKHPSMFERVAGLARDLFNLNGKDASLTPFCWGTAVVVCYNELMMNPG